MPTYDYECRKCGYEFELFQSMNDDPVSTCPRCSGPVERKIGAGAGLIFKGSGFYITDYRSDSYQKAAKAEKSAATTSTAASKSDSKSSSGSSKGKNGK